MQVWNARLCSPSFCCECATQLRLLRIDLRLLLLLLLGGGEGLLAPSRRAGKHRR